MKNKIFLTLILSLVSFSNNIIAQAPDWLWSKSIGGAKTDRGEDVTADLNGNIFITGVFDSPTITFGTTTLTNAGSSDIFVVKYDSSGNVLWAKSVGGIFSEGGQAITTDSRGNVLVTGYSNSPLLNFGKITFENESLNQYVIVLKYDANGNEVWAKKSYAGASSDMGIDISTDPTGNALVTGNFRNPSITFDETTVFNTDNRNGTSDIFVVKYDTTGNVLWAKSYGGTSGDYSEAVSTDPSGNVLVTGHFSNTSITFGTIVFPKPSFQNAVFIVKHDSMGNVLWAKTAEAPTGSVGRDISCDPAGNILVTGYFGGSYIAFEKTKFPVFNMHNFFVVKFKATGEVLWIKTGEQGVTQCISTNSSGNVFISGDFSEPSLDFGKDTLTKVGDTDFFVASYDASGKELWAKSVGGTGADFGNSIFPYSKGNLIISGNFKSPSITLGNATLLNAGDVNMFIAKLGPAPLGTIHNLTPNQASIFPNPFSTSTTIELNTTMNKGQLNVYNVHGQLVKQMKNLSGNTLTMNRESLSNGLYFVSISEYNNEILSNKVIIND